MEETKTELELLEEVAKGLDVLYPDLGDEFRFFAGLRVTDDE